MKRVLLILLILLLCGCSYDEYKMPKKVFINTIDKVYEVYDQNVKVKDLIGETNVEILNLKESLDTTNLNDNIVTIKYKYKRRTYKYDVNYKIVDTTKPIFINYDNITIEVNNDVDPCNMINVADNYDKEVFCTIEGEYDTTSVGTYNLKYVIKDSSGNTNEKDFILNVVNKISSSGNSSSSNYRKNNLLFSDVIKNYKTDDNMIGIDVSYWQKDIDYKRVKEAGCEFVIIRLGVNSDIDKDISIDSYFLQNIKNAKEQGLKVGVYVYTTAINEKMAKEHAKFVVDTLKKEKLDFKIVFDWENFSKFRSYKISMYDLTNTFLIFKDYLKKHGYDAMLYSSMNYLNNIWMFNDTYDVWLAHYTDKTSYQGKYVMWQMSNIGKIDGINADVDIDIFYKNGVNYGK